MISSQLNISHSELTLIGSYYLKQVAKVNWKKNLVQINIYWWHWHYFIMYISYWRVYQVNYKEESFAWEYIVKFAVSNKLTWKFTQRFLTTKLPSLKEYCWCLQVSLFKKLCLLIFFSCFSSNCSFFITAFILCKILWKPTSRF